VGVLKQRTINEEKQLPNDSAMKTATKAIALIGLVAVAALILGIIVLQEYGNQQPAVDYWILDVSTSGGGYVAPNGTLHVSLNQSGTDVTAYASGWNSFIDWTFDGEELANRSSTITVPKQEPNSSHALKANFIIGTPPIYQIVDGEVTMNASSFQVYAFTVPSDSQTAYIHGTFAVSNGGVEVIRVYIIDKTNFTQWQNSSQATPLFDSGQLNSGNICTKLSSHGTFFLVLDNTFDTTSIKHVKVHAYFAYFPIN
jgi:hypothetical protein